ncbi:hypothetical protein [Pedobacter puniceum]|uniref:DUF4919 domain-containing protein n=1 Tax=Pedobacter puniceum TaxID=2666136 RepID=A0A7K0FM66_9SPHI|nr:hypothetical protein [Pedobacter puniceum]MRX46912.1 hypothetical protein [Pedobacter puniceum]
MKKQVLSLLLLTILITMQNLNAQNKIYDYPIKPGSVEWKNLANTNEKINACQIPETLLLKLTTLDLLIICLDYPLLNNYTASNNPIEGLKNIVSSFNGLKEFLKREDAGKVLLEYYKNENLNKIQSYSDKGKYTFDFCALELLLCQDEIIQKLTPLQRKEALNNVIIKYNEKSKYQEYFGFYGKMTTSYIGSKYMISLGNDITITSPSKKRFVEQMAILDLSLIDEIVQDIDQYLNKSK